MNFHEIMYKNEAKMIKNANNLFEQQILMHIRIQFYAKLVS
jgi:hypothetical protein